MLAFQVEFFCSGDATQKQQLRLQEREAVDDLPLLRMRQLVLPSKPASFVPPFEARAGSTREFPAPRALNKPSRKLVIATITLVV